MPLNDGTTQQWDRAINLGTNDSDDLLQYKLIFDYAHAMLPQLANSEPGFRELTGEHDLPALDFLRSNALANSGPWRPTDIMDGSDQVEPVASLLRKARDEGRTIYVFGRKYVDGLGIHNVHMNQGSGGSFLNDGVDDHNDHNDVWQVGAVLIDLGQPEWSAYFTVFTQQMVPTDQLGNPVDGSHPMRLADDGSLV